MVIGRLAHVVGVFDYSAIVCVSFNHKFAVQGVAHEFVGLGDFGAVFIMRQGNPACAGGVIG